MLTVTIQEEQIKRADNQDKKGGRPRKGEPKRPNPKVYGYRISDEAREAIRVAAERMGVTQNAFVEALGRSIAEQMAM